MNYIELVNQFWTADIEHSFSGNETKLYFYLLNVCNKLAWKNPFKHSNSQVSSGTSISINSVKNSRIKLAEAGLIKFVPGTPGTASNINNKAEYQILTVSKIDSQSDHQSDHQSDQVNKLNKTKDNSNSNLEEKSSKLSAKNKDLVKKLQGEINDQGVGLKTEKPKRKKVAQKKESESTEFSKSDIERRKTNFKTRLWTVAKYTEHKDKTDMLKKFFEYWTEHGEKDRKMRFEKEKSYDIKRRLGTWAANEIKFSKKSSPKKTTQFKNSQVEKYDNEL